MGDFGLKVMNPGFSIDDTDIRNIALSSKYTMFKYHSDSTANLTILAGDTSGSIDFTHNLGYVPAFIAYVQHSWAESIQREMPFGAVPQPLVETTFATSSIVRCRINMISQEVDRTFTFRVIIFKDRIA
jgi:hypothetical protein